MYWPMLESAWEMCACG
jgi:integrase